MTVPPEDHPKFAEQAIRRREDTAHRQAARHEIMTARADPQEMLLYAAVTPSGTVFTHSIRATLPDAITATTNWVGKGCTWDGLKAHGWEVRLVRATISVLPEGREGLRIYQEQTGERVLR